MKILFATSEIAPWVKTGGLGDVSAALPHALAGLGHDVRVLVPAYGRLRDLLPQGQTCLELAAEGPWPAGRLVRVMREGSYTLLLLDAPELYDRPGGPYQAPGSADHEDNARRFAYLSWVAARLSVPGTALKGWMPAVLHCNDWPTGLAPALQREMAAGGRRAASVTTIHNLAYLGLYGMDVVDRLGLPAHWRGLDGAEFWGQISFLKAGLQFSDAITTVSPTYAREIRTEPLGCGLHGLLQTRSADLHGILNGVDADDWNPATDVHLVRRYDAERLAGKRACKTALQAHFGLAQDKPRMLFGVVSRLVAQKGIDLVAQCVPWLVANDCQLVVLGTGDPAVEAQLKAAAQALPDQVAVHIGFDESLAHGIEAGCDAFLMPSRYEPCGLNQMYSQRYGTPPVVHGTGGLADSVADFLADPARATGFVMPEATVPALQAAMAQALLLWRQPARWKAMQQAGMARDFAWAASAKRYVGLYQSLVKAASPRAPTGVLPAAVVAPLPGGGLADPVS